MSDGSHASLSSEDALIMHAIAREIARLNKAGGKMLCDHSRERFNILEAEKRLDALSAGIAEIQSQLFRAKSVIERFTPESGDRHIDLEDGQRIRLFKVNGETGIDVYRCI